MFGLKHIIILSICILMIVLGVIFGRKLSLKKIFGILLVVGIISESIKIIYYILSNEHSVATYVYDKTTGEMIEVFYDGYLPKTDLPFHLCSIQLIFILILNLSKNDNLKKLLMSFMLPTCMVGGFLALLIPTSSSLSSWIVMIQYFGFHTAIVIYAILLYFKEEVKFTIQDYLHTLVMLFFTFFIAIYLNSALADYVHNINFMYVVNPPQSGLPFLNKDHGWGVYITHYAITALVAVTLCYIKPIIDYFKSLKNKKTSEKQA